ncbi:ORF6N domain-containing protein [Algoriphagus algorifonticola]|uniref:ORF6N domain-containing protein n=1 Tax=Algoriphagus algorifonticola TaxID=2593007 RepID=UPI0011A3FE83|nr:ORF6N domain-containing protein [Algoriphagus algorifonticola]
MSSQELKEIENKILTIREQQVMLDSDLAVLYQTETKFINRAVNRNPKRFPNSFVFQLTKSEWGNLKYHSGTSNTHGGRRTLPYVFTEQGIAMLSSVLQTDTAVQVSVEIMKAFVEMRKLLIQSAPLFHRLFQLETKQLENEKKFDQLFNALEKDQLKPQKGIFFDGQIFDAYTFVAGLIKSAKKEIILIDNYVDETILILLNKRSSEVEATIYTKEINRNFKLDIEKHNSQYPKIFIKEFNKSHDRFLIVDNSDLYHFGASLKDLGKKWFAFSQMNDFVEILLKEIK